MPFNNSFAAAMAGGLFAIHRDYFDFIGKYDEVWMRW